jgi:hypothetical protein
LLGKGNFKIKMTIDQSFFKLSKTNHSGFGMFFFSFPCNNNDVNVLNMCHLLLICFKGLLKT